VTPEISALKFTAYLVAGALAGVLSGAWPAAASDWYVAPGGAGSGTSGAPFGRVQDAINVAQAGDTIVVRPGTYNETLSTVRPGAAGAPIVIRAEQGSGTVLVTAIGRVATFNHPYITVDGLIFDGQYGQDRAIRVTSTANFLVLRNSEVRRASRNVLEIFGPTGVLIENCLIHHALQFDPIEGRLDAHGISAGPVHDLTIRNTEIHTFSGDGLQVDPGRSAPGWTNVLVEHSHIWLQPLPAAENGFPAGVVPGENAIDTKAGAGFPRATIVLRDIVASGFKDLPSSVPPNQAAFNLKENVDAIVDGVTVYDSEIAFRLRDPANVLVKNSVVYNTLKAVRYENNITNLRFWNNTIGANVPTVFQAASASPSGLDIRNLLVLGSLPPEALGGSNLSVDASAFVNAAANDYHLAAGSSAIDVGATISEVTTDRDGISRPQGVAYDVGAYERTGGGGGGTNAPPTVTITSPADGSSSLVGQSISISASAFDSDGSVTQVAFFADGQLLSVDSSAPYSFAWSTGSAGSHTLTAVATDNRSATGTSADVHITVSTGGGGGGTSPDGTRLPPATQIVDDSGVVWTIAGNVILRNGQQTGGLGSILTWCGGQIRVFGVDNQWWRWTGGSWTPIGPTDPCGGGSPPPAGTSPDGTRLPPASQIVDDSGAVWTIAGNVILRNGQQTGGLGTIITWCGAQIRVFGVDNQWWRWTGGWTPIGPTDPCSGATPPPAGTSPDGTRLPPATQIVDDSGAVWTIDGLLILRNGQQTGGLGTTITWCGGRIHVFGTDNQWWRWTGDGWTPVGTADPCG
jgi:hypothetical protein